MKLLVNLVLITMAFQAGALETITKIALASDTLTNLKTFSRLGTTNDMICTPTSGGCYRRLSTFQPIVLRINNNWNDVAIRDKLDKESRDTIADYPQFVIKSVSLSTDGRFLAEVEFVYPKLTTMQSNYIFGVIAGTELDVQSVAEADPEQAAMRKSLKYLQNMSMNRDFQSLDHQVLLEDILRTRAVGAVLQTTVSAMAAIRSSFAEMTTNLN